MKWFWICLLVLPMAAQETIGIWSTNGSTAICLGADGVYRICSDTPTRGFHWITVVNDVVERYVLVRESDGRFVAEVKRYVTDLPYLSEVGYDVLVNDRYVGSYEHVDQAQNAAVEDVKNPPTVTILPGTECYPASGVQFDKGDEWIVNQLPTKEER